jgi:hypothetical protein
VCGSGAPVPATHATMDPVTGIGLVASVVQLLTFGIGTASTIREVYQRGSISSYEDVEHTTGYLSKLAGSLQHSLQSSNTHSSALTRDEKDLIELGRKCENCAHKYQHELRKLTSQPRTSLLAATRITARAIWKRAKIEEISKQLATYQSTLETSLLHKLRYVPRQRRLSYFSSVAVDVTLRSIARHSVKPAI